MERKTIAETLGLTAQDLMQWEDEEIADMESGVPTAVGAVSTGETFDLSVLEENVPVGSSQYLVTPKGKIVGGFYFPPIEDRNEYISLRAVEAIESKFDLYAPYISDTFYYVLRRNELNLHPPDMRRVLDLFSAYYEGPKLKVIRAMERPQRGANIHSIGLAIDIEAMDRKQAKHIADIAYRAGIPNIVYGGNFSTKNGYVHLDIGPKHVWSYEAGYYSGPGGKEGGSS